MADNSAFYRQRADADRRAAAETNLDNVRDRCLRSMRHWEEMAERAERYEKQREIREAATRARVEAAKTDDGMIEAVTA